MWQNIPGMAARDVKDAKEMVSTFSDSGKNPACEWKRLPGGTAVRIFWACSAHVDCPVKVRCVPIAGAPTIQRLADVEHATKVNEYDRANAALTKKQKSDAKQAKRHGATAVSIMKHDQVHAALLLNAA